MPGKNGLIPGSDNSFKLLALSNKTALLQHLQGTDCLLAAWHLSSFKPANLKPYSVFPGRKQPFRTISLVGL